MRFEGKRVLIVDDEFAVLESLTEVLAWEGFAVLTAANGDEGLRVLDQERPDFLVVDFMMPVINGLELCRRVRARDWAANLPIVLISAAAIPADMHRNACWNVFLRKPFGVRALLAALEEARRLAAEPGGPR